MLMITEYQLYNTLQRKIRSQIHWLNLFLVCPPDSVKNQSCLKERKKIFDAYMTSRNNEEQTTKVAVMKNMKSSIHEINLWYINKQPMVKKIKCSIPSCVAWKLKL